jgi:1-acyl-sn-glycerol-3-phosphate acyltransferase
MDSLSKSPFINDVYRNLTLRQKIQLFIMSITIAPIRVFFLLLLLGLIWPLGKLAVYNQDTRSKPMSGWRKHILYPIIIFLCRGVFFVASLHRIKVHGKPDMTVPIMSVAPHFGYFDTLLFVYLNFPNGVAREGTEDVPLFGHIVKMCQPIIVDRDKYHSRSDTVQRVVERANSKLGWSPIILFSEGTCTNGRALIQFKPGAFISALPVQPVCIDYPGMNYDSVSWTWKGSLNYIYVLLFMVIE